MNLSLAAQFLKERGKSQTNKQITDTDKIQTIMYYDV